MHAPQPQQQEPQEMQVDSPHVINPRLNPVQHPSMYQPPPQVVQPLVQPQQMQPPQQYVLLQPPLMVPPVPQVAQPAPVQQRPRAKGPPKPKVKKEKPAVCEGLPPFDFTQALRDTPLTMTVGQLMSLEKLPRAAITKAFRSPRKAKQGKQQAAYLAEEITPTASVCQATIANVPISLILDSGSSLNIVSQPLFQKLGLQVTR